MPIRSGYHRTMILETRAVGPFYKNGYLLACETTREAIVIDPGDEVGDLHELAKARDLIVRHLLLTHGHVDHVAGVALAKRLFGAPVYLHRADLPVYNSAVETGEFFGLTIEQPPAPDRFYWECPPVTFGEFAVEVLPTPGHTPGGVCLHVTHPEQGDCGLFVGDTLFAGSIGRTDLPGGDHQRLLASIRDVLLRFADEKVVYPGHGPQTTIGSERRTNPFLVS